MFNFFKMNLFKAALTPELRSVVAQQDQDTMTIKKMYQVATTAQREGKGKSPAAVNEICDEEPDPRQIRPTSKQTKEDIIADQIWIQQTRRIRQWKQCKLEWQVLLLLQTTRALTGRMLEKDQGEQTMPGHSRMNIQAQNLLYGIEFVR